MIKTKEEIKAKVLFDWNHHNCKLLPGDECMVTQLGSERNIRYLRKTLNKHGKVVAVSSPDGKKIRGEYNGRWNFGRAYTRYYVMFDEGTPKQHIVGLHSHYIEKLYSA